MVTRAGVVDNVQRLTDGGSDDVLGKIGLVFRPFRLDDAGLGILILHRKTHACPEILQQGPNTVGRYCNVNVAELTVRTTLA